MKIYGCEGANDDFPCTKLENAKKYSQKIFWAIIWKNPELILINMSSPAFVRNLVTLAWKISSGMPKEASSLNGPLCTYIMRQNMIKLVWDLRATTITQSPWGLQGNSYNFKLIWDYSTNYTKFIGVNMWPYKDHYINRFITPHKIFVSMVYYQMKNMVPA